MSFQEIKLFDSIEEGLDITRNGAIKTIKIDDGTRYCLFQSGGKLKVSEFSCPHMGYPLNQGIITPFGEITCPWHNYRFDLRTGFESQNRCRDLKLVEVIVNKKGVFLKIPD